MRLWHKDLIRYLPRQQLLGQWRECCAIAKSIAETGTPNHVLVNKVLEYPKLHFVLYGFKIIEEMEKRGYKCIAYKFTVWTDMPWDSEKPVPGLWKQLNTEIFEGWHNDRYLKQCLMNLQEKADCGAIPAEEWKKITDRWPEFK